jgi:predicted component of type VI protein secretion system
MTILLKPTQGGRPIVLDKPILLIGRHPDCDVILKNSGKISRKHCCVALVDNRFVVRDLDSMNGVWVNSERVNHSASLRMGDELMIGDLPFTLTKHKEQEVARQRPAPQRADATVAEIDPNDIRLIRTGCSCRACCIRRVERTPRSCQCRPVRRRRIQFRLCHPAA